MSIKLLKPMLFALAASTVTISSITTVTARPEFCNPPATVPTNCADCHNGAPDKKNYNGNCNLFNQPMNNNPQPMPQGGGNGLQQPMPIGVPGRYGQPTSPIARTGSQPQGGQQGGFGQGGQQQMPQGGQQGGFGQGGQQQMPQGGQQGGFGGQQPMPNNGNNGNNGNMNNGNNKNNDDDDDH